MTQEELHKKAEELLPQGFEALMSWAMTLSPQEQAWFIEWSEERQKQLNAAAANVKNVFDKINKGLQS